MQNAELKGKALATGTAIVVGRFKQARGAQQGRARLIMEDRMRCPLRYFFGSVDGDAHRFEADSGQCPHGGVHSIVAPRHDTATLGRFFTNWMGQCCPKPACKQTWLPLMQATEQQEAQDRLLQGVGVCLLVCLFAVPAWAQPHVEVTKTTVARGGGANMCAFAAASNSLPNISYRYLGPFTVSYPEATNGSPLTGMSFGPAKTQVDAIREQTGADHLIAPSDTTNPLSISASVASAVVGQSYTVTGVADISSSDTHNIRLDGRPYLPSDCTTTTCTKTLTTTATTVGTVTHTLAGTHRDETAWPTVTTSVTVTAGTTPPPPPAPEWSTPTALQPVSPLYFSGAADGSVVAALVGGVEVIVSEDEGATWRPPVTLGPGTPYLERPLAISGSTMVAMVVRVTRNLTDWCCNRPVGDYWASISTDKGRTFAPPFQLSRGQAALRGSVAIANGVVHFTWMDYRTGVWDLYYRRFASGVWGKEIKLVSGGRSQLGAQRPSIAAAGQTVHLVWFDGRDRLPTCTIDSGTRLPECSEVYTKRSLDAGLTWGPERRLTNDTPYSGRSTVAVDGTTVYIAYDHRVLGENNDIGWLRSADNGTTWTQAIVAPDLAESTHPGLAAGRGEVLLAWMGILATSSTDYGLTFSPSAVVAPIENSVPAVGLSDNYAHIIYTDGTSTVHRRKARRTTPPPPPPPPTNPSTADPFAVTVDPR